MKRFEYISANLPHFSRGGVELVESGNLPVFAQGCPSTFWCAVDEHERINARLFSEIEVALPFELDHAQREMLVRDALKKFVGDSFPYTMAVHHLMDAEGRMQRHMHVMFCERAVKLDTRFLRSEEFFKRNGAKKDPAWNRRSKPYELRVRWCDLLNAALTSAGFVSHLSPGKSVDAVEPKILSKGGRVDTDAARETGPIRREKRRIRRLIEECERSAMLEIAAIEARRDAELAKLG